MSSLVSKVIVDGSECKKINYTGATYKFEANELFEISDANYLPDYDRYSETEAYIWPCHFGIDIGNGCYYVTTPQFCKRFYNIYATPEDRITQNTPEGYIEFSKFYDKFYSSIDNPELMYHYDSTHKIFYIIKKAYLMHNPDKNSGQGGHGNSYHWYWPRFYVMSVPREVGGNIVCLGQQYNEDCLDVANNKIVFDKVITKTTSSTDYTDVNVGPIKYRVTLPNNDFIKCYTENNPKRDPDDVPSLNTYGTFSESRMKRLSIFEKETIFIKEMSQKYYFLMEVDYKYSWAYENEGAEFVVIEMEIIQSGSDDLSSWGLTVKSTDGMPVVSNFVWYRTDNLFRSVYVDYFGNIPFFKKSDTNGYVYNFVTKIDSVYLAMVPLKYMHWKRDPWDLDLLNINGPLARQSSEPTRTKVVGDRGTEEERYMFTTYSGYKKYLDIPSLSYLYDNSDGIENFYNHEFSVVRSNLFVN